MVNEEVKFTIVAEDGFSEVIKDFKAQWAEVKNTLEQGVQSKAKAEKPTIGATKPTTEIGGGEKGDKAVEKNKSALADMLKGGKKKEGEGPEVEGGMKIPKEYGTFLRAIGMYRAAWLTGRQIGGKEKETGKMSKEGMLMGAAAGIFVLQSIKDGVMKIVQVLADASPYLRAQLKILNIGFMQILKPFGDMVGMALKPIAKMMLQFARNARVALKDAGITMKNDPKAYMSAYTNMLMHGLYHGLIKGEAMPVGDFKDIAEKFKLSQESLDKLEYLKMLGGTESQLEGYREFLSPGGETFGQSWNLSEDVHYNNLLQTLREQWDKAHPGQEMVHMQDYIKMTQEQQEAFVANTALVDSNWAIVSTNTALKTTIDFFRMALERGRTQGGSQIKTINPQLNPVYNQMWNEETGGFLNEYQRGMGRAWRL